MKANFLTRYAPPGVDVDREKKCFLMGLALASLWSTTFLTRYFAEIASLYEYRNEKYVLRSDAVMVDFYELLKTSFLGFFILAICMLALIFYHYATYSQGAKSIYLMKRLPNKWLLHKQSLTLPLFSILLCSLAALILFLLYFALYMLATPEACLQPNQWQKLWGYLL